jgi:inosose dehydratase
MLRPQAGWRAGPAQERPGGNVLNQTITRRVFAKNAGAAATATALLSRASFSQQTRDIHVGHTGITWPNTYADQAIRDIGSLGFYGYETFGEVLVRMDAEGDFAQLLEANHVPLISGYCTINLTNPAKKTDELTKATNWARLIKKYGGRVFVLGPNPVNRDSYDYAANKANIISMLNETAKAVTDEGITPVLHQHTGTCVESRDETYATLEAADTNVLKFGPDVGQLTKGGSDAVQVVKDFLPIVQHMHLKDFAGTDDHLLGYCPLGQGKVNVPAILDLMEGRQLHGMIMVELDNNFRDISPTPPYDLARQSANYLKSLGVRFRT